MASFVGRSLIQTLKRLRNVENDVLSASKKAKGKYSGSIKLSLREINIEGLSDLIEQFPDAMARAHKLTMDIICNDLQAALDEAMDADVWLWSDGKTRDIVDTRRLSESGSVKFDPVSENIVIRYNSEYAGIVHFGGIIQSPWNPSAEIYYPERPWIEAVLTGNGPVPRFNFSKAYEDNIYRFLEKELGL